MSEWHVSASESEGEGGRETKEEAGDLELGGLKIPTARMVELLQAVEKRSTAELECLSLVRRKRHGHRKKKHRRSHGIAGESPSHGGSGVKSTEEVSETTSDVRSTTSTNITAECRDTRRPDFSKFDPSLDPELDDDPGVAIKTAPRPLTSRKAPPNHLKEKKLASLEKITADTIKRKQRWHQQMQQELTTENTSPVSSTTTSTFVHNSTNVHPTMSANLQTEHPAGGGIGVEMFNDERGIPDVQSGDEEVSIMEVDRVGRGESRQWQQDEGEARREARELPSFRFEDDEDSEGEMNSSEVDMKLSILSQINRVENLLDTETLT